LLKQKGSQESSPSGRCFLRKAALGEGAEGTRVRGLNTINF